MKRILSGFTAALLTGLLAISFVSKVEAAPYTSYSQSTGAVSQNADLLKLAGYYDRGHGHGWRDDYEDDYDHGSSCGYTRYKKKWVCDRDEPRCFKQRKCIWYYGREYCRYVRKCVGGREHCKWIKVPVRDCGCRKCW